MKNFIKRWLNRGDEKSDTQTFWLEFLREILGNENPGQIIKFEKRVRDKHVNFIDCYIAATQTLIEQKSIHVDLDAKIKQADGEELTPFEQAKKYYGNLPHFENPRWIITCNFQEFRIYDMNLSNEKDYKPEIIKLENLETEWQKFLFMVDPEAIAAHEVRISQEAGRLVEKLKDSLMPRYKNPDNDEFIQKRNERSLTVFCVRIVFLLYAEDSGLLEKSQFHDYLKPRAIIARDTLKKIFDVLSIKIEDRDEYDEYLDEDIKKFPYVNGGLFDKKINIKIPQLDGEPLKIILEDMSEAFDWSEISPPIFGAIFERVLGGERDAGGMHYTTLENIHKVIDPLFLDDLNAELENIFDMPKTQERTQKLLNFQDRLAKLKFLDPACGSGNFLTESFISLRKIENKILRELLNLNPKGNFEIKVSISQFHGIEVNDFAVAVTRTALWIADNQMLKEAEDLIQESPLPLKDFDHIKEGSAMDKLEGLAWGLPGWKIHHDDMLYIMGNPPFLGYSQQSPGQKEDVKNLIGNGKVDYVACWFAIASEYVQDKKTKAAFVATNSITQGEQVAAIFKPLYERWGIEIDFAHQSFVWDSELKDNLAHVHCVVIGFSTDKTPRLKKLFTPEGLKLVENINFYLRDAPNFFIKARKTPICPDAPVMTLGNMPRDGGNLILTPEEKDKLLEKEPQAEKFIRRYMMGEDFINGITRYCLWLVDAKPKELANMKQVMKRIKAVKAFRLASKREITRKNADTSRAFAEIRQPDVNYLVVPKTSSSARFYVPIGWHDPSTISGDELKVIPNTSLYHFGVLTSCVHMAWMRATAGRFGMGYRYSSTIVYNNFIWPSVNKKQKAKIERTAKKILDVREKFPESSFADLYNPLTMPPELLRAHKANDAAVIAAYGWDKNISEEEIVSELMTLYKNFVEK